MLLCSFIIVTIVHPKTFAQLPAPMKYKVIVADEGNGKVHYINLANPAEKWSATTPNRDLQLIGNDRLMVSVGDGHAEYNVKTGALIKKVATTGSVQSAFRTSCKSTFIGADGSPGRPRRTLPQG